MQVNGEHVYRTILVNITSNQLLEVIFEGGDAAEWVLNFSAPGLPAMRRGDTGGGATRSVERLEATPEQPSNSSGKLTAPGTQDHHDDEAVRLSCHFSLPLFRLAAL